MLSSDSKNSTIHLPPSFSLPLTPSVVSSQQLRLDISLLDSPSHPQSHAMSSNSTVPSTPGTTISESSAPSQRLNVENSGQTTPLQTPKGHLLSGASIYGTYVASGSSKVSTLTPTPSTWIVDISSHYRNRLQNPHSPHTTLVRISTATVNTLIEQLYRICFASPASFAQCCLLAWS